MKLPEIGLGCANLLKATLPEFIDTAARHGFRTITVRPAAFAAALEAGFTEAELRRRLAIRHVQFRKHSIKHPTSHCKRVSRISTGKPAAHVTKAPSRIRARACGRSENDNR